MRGSTDVIVEQASVCTLVVIAFVAGRFHVKRDAHGQIQIETWHDSFGTMHVSRSTGSARPEAKANTHSTELGRLQEQLSYLDRVSQLLGYASSSDEAMSKIAGLLGLSLLQ